MSLYQQKLPEAGFGWYIEGTVRQITNIVLVLIAAEGPYSNGSSFVVSSEGKAYHRVLYLSRCSKNRLAAEGLGEAIIEISQTQGE